MSSLSTLLLVTLLILVGLLDQVDAKRIQLVGREDITSSSSPSSPHSHPSSSTPTTIPSSSLASSFVSNDEVLRLHDPTLSRPLLYSYLDHADPRIAGKASQALNCSICTTLVKLIEPAVFKNLTITIIEDIAILYCEMMKPLCHSSQACSAVCHGIVGEYMPVVVPLMHDLITPLNTCAFIHFCPAQPKPTPPPITQIPVRSDLTNYEGEQEWASWSLTQGTGTIVHLTDAHLDDSYTPGANANCPLPICCHTTDGTGTNPSNTAGYWGDSRCDTSTQLAQDMLSFIGAMNPPPDFILYTGDDPSHKVWEQSQQGNLNALRRWNLLMNATFGSSIPVFSTLGNHEIFPINQFAGPGFDDWLYNGAVDAWSPFLPEDAQATLAYGGYYQARIRPGLRVISLNSNYFTNDNFWLLANQSDAWDQLNWFRDVLDQMQPLNESAIIICHAPLLDWNSDFAEALLQIVEIYSSSIVNLMMGHTHNNQYATLKSLTTGVPTHVAFVAGSIVPYTNLNPGFTVYEYDRGMVADRLDGVEYPYLVQRAVAHWIDLVEANAQNNTGDQWGVERYDMFSLGVSTLDPVSLASIGPSFITNETCYNLYINAEYKGIYQTQPDSPMHVACAVTSNTDKELHACLHVKGAKEHEIQEQEHLKKLNC